MGMYTGVTTDVILRDPPEELIEWLRWIVTSHRAGHEPTGLDHPFMSKHRRGFVLRSSCVYYNDGEDPVLTEPSAVDRLGAIAESDDARRYRLFAGGGLKNYEKEIEAWIDMLSPFVESGSIAWHYEEWPDPTEEVGDSWKFMRWENGVSRLEEPQPEEDPLLGYGWNQ